MAQTKTTPSVDRVVGAFVMLMRESLEPHEFFDMQIRNATADAGVCHSHDFRDANVIMDEAFSLIAGRETDSLDVDEGDLAVWNAAWDIAKEEYFTDRTTTIVTLTAEYEAWLEAEKLEKVCAEELSLDPALTHQQRQWLILFVRRWDIVRDAGRES